MSEFGWRECALAPFGIELTGVDLAAPLPEGLADRLPGLLDRHKLILLRDQRLNEDQQADFCAHFGPVLGARGEYRQLSSDGNLGAGPLSWHSDLAFTEEPFQAISLLATKVNDGQSWTAFADGTRPLPAELAERLKDRDALTVISMIQTHRTVGYNVPDFLPHMVRPAVITHPRTAEPVLYVSDMQTARIEGLAKVESDALLQDLFAHLYDPANVYRHHWRNGDLVIWDNVALSHSRCDLAGMHPRKMQRVCCARRSFFDLLPNFSLDDPRIAAWGKGEVLVLEDSQGDA